MISYPDRITDIHIRNKLREIIDVVNSTERQSDSNRSAILSLKPALTLPEIQAALQLSGTNPINVTGLLGYLQNPQTAAQVGLFSARPPYGAVAKGALYYASDQSTAYIASASAWDTIAKRILFGGNYAILAAILTGDRTYTLPDDTGTLVYEVAALVASQLVLGQGTSKVKTLGSLGTASQVLHGNAGGDPTWDDVDLTSEVEGVLPVANGGTGGQAFDSIAATGSATGQTGAVASICTYTPSNAVHFFEVAGYVDVTAFTAGTISLQCSYTDPSGSAQTVTIPLASLAGTFAATVGSATDAHSATLGIVTSGANAITMKTSVNLLTATYNVYAWIKLIA